MEIYASYASTEANHLWALAALVNRGRPRLPFLDSTEFVKIEPNGLRGWGEPPFASTSAEDGFERFPVYDHKWYSTPEASHGVNQDDLYCLRIGEDDIARAWVRKADSGAGSSYPCGRLKGTVREIYLIEVEVTSGYRGVGSYFLKRLVETDQQATWITYSHNDSFWNSTRWERFEHSDGISSALFVLPLHLQAAQENS